MLVTKPGLTKSFIDPVFDRYYEILVKESATSTCI